VLRRFTRDGGMPESLIPTTALRDDQALFHRSGPLALTLGPDTRIVLEDYTFSHAGDLPSLSSHPPPISPDATSSRSLGEHFRGLVASDPAWGEVTQRLVVVNDSVLCAFARLACELAQHIAVDHPSGAAAPGSFHMQENVPAETLFYATAHCLRQRASAPAPAGPEELEQMATRLHRRVFQFGSDASTGLGFCTVEIKTAA
jgi:CRISPR/Cas system CMR subunit Cmr4 (Cas7 group RAMP superfamily)